MVMGWEKYLNLRKESVWGTKHGSNADIYLPYTEYSVGVSEENQQPEVFTGLRQRRYNVRGRKTLAGNLACPLWSYHVDSASIAEHLIKWANDNADSSSLVSYTAELADGGIDPKRHLGLRVGTMEIAGSANAPDVTISLGITGKNELGSEDSVTVPALSNTAPLPVAFKFFDCHLYLTTESEASSARSSAAALGDEIYIREFRIAFANTLAPRYNNDRWVGSIGAGMRIIDVSFMIEKIAANYDVIRRSTSIVNRAARLRLVGSHGGTGASGTNTVINFHFDRLNFNGMTDTSPLNDFVDQNTNWVVLKPATSSQDLNVYFTLE